jgi:hypothetical protein
MLDRPTHMALGATEGLTIDPCKFRAKIYLPDGRQINADIGVFHIVIHSFIYRRTASATSSIRVRVWNNRLANRLP